MHLMLGLSVDHINKFILNLSLKGIAKLNPHSVKQAEAMTPEILLNIAKVLNLDDKTDLVYWCLFLFAFFLLARKSNLVPTTTKDISLKHCLFRENVDDCGNYLMVSFKWTKTIQAGERILTLPLVRIKGSILCPVKAYRKMCSAIKAANDAPLFLLPNNKVVTYKMFQNKLRETIQKIGLDSKQFSSHSFRRGGATLAFRAKISADKIKLLGDWKSDCYRKYLDFSFEDKIVVSKVMTQHIIRESSVSSSFT